MAAAAAAVFCVLRSFVSQHHASSPTWLKLEIIYRSFTSVRMDGLLCAVSAVFQLLTIRFLFHD